MGLKYKNKGDKNMKKSLTALSIAAIVALAGTSPLMARSWGGGWGGGYHNGMCGGFGAGMGQSFHHIDRMQYFLNLSDAQVDKIYKVDSEYRDKYYQNRKNYDTIQKLREEHKKAILNILTKEQKEKWDSFIKERDERVNQNRYERDNRQRGNRRGYGPRR